MCACCGACCSNCIQAILLANSTGVKAQHTCNTAWLLQQDRGVLFMFYHITFAQGAVLREGLLGAGMLYCSATIVQGLESQADGLLMLLQLCMSQGQAGRQAGRS